jgi:hypothetical protein
MWIAAAAKVGKTRWLWTTLTRGEGVLIEPNLVAPNGGIGYRVSLFQGDLDHDATTHKGGTP